VQSLGGRFIELGKRDFYANSRIGLRPFRNNVSYFGVDMDALTKHERSLGCTQFSEMARCIMDGSYRPLLYRTYPGSRVDEAFRLMQNSRHVGKVVVTLDDPIFSQKRTPRLQLAADGTYLWSAALMASARQRRAGWPLVAHDTWPWLVGAVRQRREHPR
jgi:hypothetical protein